MLVALAAAVQARNTFPLERENAARGRSGRHVEAGVSVERRDAQRAAERREVERHGPGENHVEAVAPELLVRRDGHEHVEIAGTSAPPARVSLPRETQPRAVVHAGGDRNRERSRAARAAVAATLGTRVLDALAGALAVGTRAGEGEETLPVLDAALAPARRARDGRGPAAASAPLARIAALVALDRERDLRAEGGVLERKGDLGLLVLAVAPASARVSPRREAEQVSENVGEVHELRRVEPRPARAPHRLVPEAVVALSLFGVRKDGIGLGRRLELLFGALVLGVLVGMVLQRRLAIGGLDLFGGGGSPHTEYLVVVANGCTHGRLLRRGSQAGFSAPSPRRSLDSGL